MSVSIRPLHPLFVGEVAGIDCHQPLGADEVAAIEAGMDRYAVLVFRDQLLTDEAQLAFTRHFGELEAYQTPGHIRRRAAQRLGPGMADFSNLDKDGNIIAADDRVWFFKLADRLWHSDSSFRPVPAKYSLLSARILPSWGGNTTVGGSRKTTAHLKNAGFLSLFVVADLPPSAYIFVGNLWEGRYGTCRSQRKTRYPIGPRGSQAAQVAVLGGDLARLRLGV